MLSRYVAVRLRLICRPFGLCGRVSDIEYVLNEFDCKPCISLPGSMSFNTTKSLRAEDKRPFSLNTILAKSSKNSSSGAFSTNRTSEIGLYWSQTYNAGRQLCQGTNTPRDPYTLIIGSQPVIQTWPNTNLGPSHRDVEVESAPWTDLGKDIESLSRLLNAHER